MNTCITVNARTLYVRVHFCGTGKMVPTERALLFQWHSLVPVEPLCALRGVPKAAESLPPHLGSVTL